MLHQKIVHKIKELPNDQDCQLKTKLQSACKKYNCVKVPFKYREVKSKLPNKSNMIYLHQDKGRYFVVIDRKKCKEMHGHVKY